jgi:hypothetical protein
MEQEPEEEHVMDAHKCSGPLGYSAGPGLIEIGFAVQSCDSVESFADT